MALSTYGDLITRSLRRIGVVGAGQTPSSEDSTDGLDLLNLMLDSFATERLFIPSVTRTTWTIVSGTGAYTVGSGGAVNIVRPVFVKDVKFQDTSISPTLEMPLTSLTDQDYANIPQKTQTAPYPVAYYYNPTFSGAGYATITFYFVPTSSTLEGVLYAPATLSQVASLSTTLLLQPGYRFMLQENLSAMMAPEWGVPLPQELRESARESKANVKRANIRLVEMASFEGNALAGSGSYDIRTDS